MLSGDFHKHSMIYWSMAIFDYKRGDGGLVDILKKQSIDARIRGYLEEIKKFRNHKLELQLKILAPKDACEVCRQDDEKLYDFKYFETLNPLPHKGCTCIGFGCSCTIISTNKDTFDEFLETLGNDEDLVRSKKFSKEDDVLMKSGAAGCLNILNIFGYKSKFI